MDGKHAEVELKAAGGAGGDCEKRDVVGGWCTGHAGGMAPAQEIIPAALLPTPTQGRMAPWPAEENLIVLVVIRGWGRGSVGGG
jgi:hypothetical protein